MSNKLMNLRENIKQKASCSTPCHLTQSFDLLVGLKHNFITCDVCDVWRVLCLCHLSAEAGPGARPASSPGLYAAPLRLCWDLIPAGRADHLHQRLLDSQAGALHLLPLLPALYHGDPVAPGEDDLPVQDVVPEESFSLVTICIPRRVSSTPSPGLALVHLNTPCPIIFPPTNSASRLLPFGYLMKPLPCSSPWLYSPSYTAPSLNVVVPLPSLSPPTQLPVKLTLQETVSWLGVISPSLACCTCHCWSSRWCQSRAASKQISLHSPLYHTKVTWVSPNLLRPFTSPSYSPALRSSELRKSYRYNKQLRLSLWSLVLPLL